METFVDAILHGDKPRKAHEEAEAVRKLEAGIEQFWRDPLLHSVKKGIAVTLAHRTEAIWCSEPIRAVCEILSQINSTDRTFSIIVDNLLTPEEREFHKNQLQAIAAGENYLHKRAKPLEIEVDDTMTLSLAYGPSQWEGITALYLFVMDKENGANPLPFYVVRGNPIYKDEKVGFKIRSIQPWIADRVSSIRSITKRQYGFDEQNPALLAKLDLAVGQRQRVVSKFMRKIDKGDAVSTQKYALSEKDFVLLSALAYFQGLGVSKFWGLSQDFHPAAKGNTSMSVNFDTFFDYWFDKNDADTELHRTLYPRALDTDNSRCYIPHFAHFSGTSRSSLLAIFSESARA